MKTTLHLVSMPFERTNIPSIQLGCLKAYVDQRFAGRVSTFCYSAFLGILVQPTARGRELLRNPMFDTVTELEATTLRSTSGTIRATPRYLVGELPYMLLYQRRFGTDVVRSSLAASLNHAVVSTTADSQWLVDDCASEKNLEALEAATVEYVERRIIPNLSPDGVNLVGFTCTFNQTYASAYCMRLLQARCPEHRLVFVFGGSSMGMPATAAALRKLELDALCVIGEGELKLTRLLETCLNTEDAASTSDLTQQLLDPAAGIVHACSDYNCRARNPAYSSRQLGTLNVLPCPDYDEFFDELGSKCVDLEERSVSRAQVELPLEGSRGCAFSCTFCNLNHLWAGYRLQDAEIILSHVLQLQQQYGTPASRIRFVDNLCNWASGFADAAIARGLKINCFLELRARYPESFWRKLNVLGVWGVQIGIESLSSALLEVMDKKSQAIDNVRAMKFMEEQRVAHRSNFIINYPRSTMEHVEETRRVLSHLTHLRPLDSTEYELVEGSPLYYGLLDTEKGVLEPDRGLAYAELLAPFVTDYAFAVPDSLSPPLEVLSAWREVTAWYREATATPKSFRIEDRGDHVWVYDDRWGEARELQLVDKQKVILSACHRGLKIEQVAESAGVTLDEAKEILGTLVADRLLLEIDGRFMNVGIRPPAEVTGPSVMDAPLPTVLREAGKLGLRVV